MMKWAEDYENLSEKEKERFQKTINILLNKTFLVYNREQDRPYYRFVEKHFDIFQGYLNMARWEILYNRRLSVLQAYNIEEKNRRRFNLQETIFLLILRLLYDEKKKDLQLTKDVVAAGFEIQEKYMALQIKERLPSREEMTRILRLFSSFSLLDLKKGHYKDPEATYILYPSLQMVIDDAKLETSKELLNKELLDDEEIIENLEEEEEDDNEEENILEEKEE
ncbi:DUF4194 domain-containing protein [Natranaerofaba carboxydovora]|uniref:DUF4194 domain-containing protein n=1 Tax=Natranaerofaba carboxydovora TaxID=2742683 RepID=UPI001F1329B5|nr:DUF4194 domain-containing protein [Natranaerofaba carboxydovora]UMZ74964.1 hypothetical protein ACONDI_02570 [Natranaerofaba carboxydovora]